MTESRHQAVIVRVLMNRLIKYGLPRAQKLQAKVSRGEQLNDFDLAFLQQMFEDTQNVKPLVDKLPHYQPLVLQMIRMYKEIADKALDNENKPNP